MEVLAALLKLHNVFEHRFLVLVREKAPRFVRPVPNYRLVDLRRVLYRFAHGVSSRPVTTYQPAHLGQLYRIDVASIFPKQVPKKYSKRVQSGSLVIDDEDPSSPTKLDQPQALPTTRREVPEDVPPPAYTGLK